MPNPKLLYPSLITDFFTAVWRTDDLGKSNCYAFALTCPEAGIAVPGNLNNHEHRGLKPNEMTTTLVKELLKKDGLQEIQKKDVESSRTKVLAVRLAPRMDFHCCVKDKTGWAHMRSSNDYFEYTDDNCQIIEDPEIATFFMDPRKKILPYTEFCGFFIIPDEGILYIPR